MLTVLKYIALVGGEEYERGMIKLRDLATKEEKELPVEKQPFYLIRGECPQTMKLVVNYCD